MKKFVSALITVLGTLMLVGAAYADHTRYQTSNVVDVGVDGYQGAAWLIRSEDGIQGRIMSKVSTAGDPYTLWIVVFNNPDACVGPCDETDLGIPEVGASVFNGTGAISSPDGGLKRNGKPAGGGVVNVDFSIPAHPLPNGLFKLFGDPAGLHQGNGYGAEVHLVIDRHPPIASGMSWLSDLTTTNFPGAGPAANDVFAVFLACPDASCPGNVL